MKILIQRFVPFSISYSIVILSICLMALVDGTPYLPLNILWGTALVVAFIQMVDILLYQIDFKKAWHLYTIEYLLIFTVSFLLGSFAFRWYGFSIKNAITMGLWMLFIYILIISYFKRRNKMVADQINKAIQRKEEIEK